MTQMWNGNTSFGEKRGSGLILKLFPFSLNPAKAQALYKGGPGRAVAKRATASPQARTISCSNDCPYSPWTRALAMEPAPLVSPDPQDLCNISHFSAGHFQKVTDSDHSPIVSCILKLSEQFLMVLIHFSLYEMYGLSHEGAN